MRARPQNARWQAGFELVAAGGIRYFSVWEKPSNRFAPAFFLQLPPSCLEVDRVDQSREIRISDRIRRWVNRCGFFTLGLLPTAIVLVWICTPVSVERHAQELEQRLGWPVVFVNHSTPRPGHARADQMRIRLGPQEQVIGHGLRQQRSAGQTRLNLRAAEIPAPSTLPKLCLTAWQRQVAAQQAGTLVINIERVRFQDPSSPLEIFDVTIRSDMTASELRSEIGLSLSAGSAERFYCHISQKLEPATEPGYGESAEPDPAFQWTVLGRDVDIPLPLLSMFEPSLACLGPQATFRGHISGVRSTSGQPSDSANQVTMRGILQHVDAGCCEWITGLDCRGELHIDMDSCVWSAGKLQELCARVESQSLVVDSHILRTLVQFGFLATEAPTSQELRNVRFGFKLANDRLQVWGPRDTATLGQLANGQPALALPHAQASHEMPGIEFLSQLMLRPDTPTVPLTAESLDVFRQIQR